MPFYITELPTDDESWNYYLLYNLSLVKHRIIGMFYIPDLRYYGPVLDLDESDLAKVDKSIFHEVDDDKLLNAYAMVCRMCGWCCEAECGAFLFDHELEEVRRFLQTDFTPPEHEYVRLKDGRRVRIWWLESGTVGQCVFFDPGTKRCRIHPVRPVICMVTFCARYAIDKFGQKYVRVGTADPEGRVTFTRTDW